MDLLCNELLEMVWLVWLVLLMVCSRLFCWTVGRLVILLVWILHCVLVWCATMCQHIVFDWLMVVWCVQLVVCLFRCCLVKFTIVDDFLCWTVMFHWFLEWNFYGRWSLLLILRIDGLQSFMLGSSIVCQLVLLATMGNVMMLTWHNVCLLTWHHVCVLTWHQNFQMLPYVSRVLTVV